MNICIGRSLLALALMQSSTFAQVQVDEYEQSLTEDTQVNTQIVDETSATSETVRERYSDGKVHIEKQVAMSSAGDYVNHGIYREYSPKGDVLLEGSYQWGVMSGTWVKHLDGNEAKKVQQQLSVAFKPPFVSTAEFAGGKLNNMWTIVDKDNKVVIQVELKDGLRDGTTTVYGPGGEIKLQQTFALGMLSGSAFEKLEGKNARDEKFTSGRKTIEDTQRQANGNALKSTHTYLSPVHQIGTPDNWSDSTFGKVTTVGEKMLHGAFTIYFENGKPASKGTYNHGQLDGTFESWHRNGEIAITGQYNNGVQVGNWVWRHPNGMKEAIANYVDGKPDGRILAWDQNGKAVNASTLVKTKSADERASKAAPN